MASEIHVGDGGTSFEVVFVDEDGDIIDISLASSKVIWFERPDLTTFEMAGSFVTSGTDGALRYVTENDDLNQDGPWRYQGRATLSGKYVHTNIFKFKVKPNLRED